MKTMTLGEHLDELRLRVIFAFVALLLTTCVCFYFADALLKLIVNPFLQIMKEQGYMPRVVQSNIAGAFLAHLKVALLTGFFFSSPFIFYQGWAFIGAGLYPEEKKYVYLFAPLSIACFLLGVLFFYYLVLPFGLRFLIAYGNSPENRFIEPLITIDEYFTFFLVMAFVLGTTFEVPIVMGFLSQAKIVQSETFQKQFRFFILFAFIFAAILTPPDVATQILVAVPMILLYQVGIVLARYLEGKSKSTKNILLIAFVPVLLGGVVFYVSFVVFKESPLNTTALEETIVELFLEEPSVLGSEEVLLPFVIEATKDPHPKTRLQALQKIRLQKPSQAKSLFQQALQDPDFGVFCFACWVLKEDFQSSAGVPLLIEYLQSASYSQRSLAFVLLKRWNPDLSGYDPGLSPESQSKAIQQWDQWYRQQKH